MRQHAIHNTVYYLNKFNMKKNLELSQILVSKLTGGLGKRNGAARGSEPGLHLFRLLHHKLQYQIQHGWKHIP